MGLAFLAGIPACEAIKPGDVPFAMPSDTVQCVATLDREDGARLAIGLLVHTTLRVDSAGPYLVDGQLYQDRRRGDVSKANSRGVDMSNSALDMGHPTRVYAAQAGPLPVTLWFPGSELHVRARKAEAWVDMQVMDTTWFSPKGVATANPNPMHHFRCRIERIDPGAFVTRLPGQGEVPPLPKAIRGRP